MVMVGLAENQLLLLPKGIIGIQRTESREELAQLYSIADLYFNPTYEDNFPTTNIEALACGTPVVTYNTGGSPEAVDDETGYVVKQGDFMSLNNIIDQVSSKGKEHYQRVCRKRAEQYYDKNKCFEEYMRLYDKLCVK